MSSAAIVAIAVVVVVLLAGAAVFAALRRRDIVGAVGLSRETVKRDRSRAGVQVDEPAKVATAAPVTGREVELAARQSELEPVDTSTAVAPYVPPDPETVGVTRRQFFNRTLVGAMGLGLTGFGAACLGFLWPKKGVGFGGKVTVASLADLPGLIRQNSGFLYVPEGRAWVTSYPQEAIPKAEKVYLPPLVQGMKDAGVVALYQKCPHLGCRVPQCVSSQWFECPCHGSQYNRVGEKKGGPAPRGMDRFAVTVNSGSVVIDTGNVFQGPAIGTNTTGQEAEGPHCIGSVGGHG